MAIKNYKPTTSSRRNYSTIDNSDLTVEKEGSSKKRVKPLKSLLVGLSKKGGRTNNGRTTSYKKSGGHKKRYRTIDFRRNKFDVPGKIATIEYDPNRNARIALVHYADGDKRYIIAPEGVKVGQEIITSAKADIKAGNCLPIDNIPVGTFIYNIELKRGKGGQIARSAGNYAQLTAKEGDYAQVKLPSGEVRMVKRNCLATIGTVSNAEFSNMVIGKAGRNRWLGKRPTVRGVAMNPVDHPLGGGEGRTSGGRHPVTPWGKSCKGVKTRKNKRTNQYIVTRRKSKKKKK